jgi:hypothetical protein
MQQARARLRPLEGDFIAAQHGDHIRPNRRSRPQRRNRC